MSGTVRLAALMLCCASAAAQGEEPPLTATEHNPRAYGHFIGDVITRRIDVDMPDGLVLDADSLPRAGRPGQALELRRATWQSASSFGAGPATLVLDYQVFIAPREVRTFELPPITLRFAGVPRAQTLRIDAWPVTVAPLVPLDASPRHGLGELRPDVAPPLIETHAARRRFAAYGVAAALLLGYLAQVYIAGPWLARRARPFGRAWGEVRGLSSASPAAQQRAAMQAVHQALNLTAGRVLFEPGVAAFIESHPRFGPMQAELAEFFRRSRATFFGGDAAAIDADWLRALCRRARDLERGSA